MTTINIEYFGMEGSGPTVKEAKQHALFHIVQNAWDGEEGEALDLLCEGLDRQKVADMRTWARRQNFVREARGKDMEDEAVRQYANEHQYACAR